MDEQTKDIVAILTESGVQTRRERAAFVAKLRDEMGLTFEQIGTQLNVGKVRAGQLYQLNKLFNRRPPVFSNLSTRAWHFLENIASFRKFPQGWEQSPEMAAKLLNTLAQMTTAECLKFRSCGRNTLTEIERLLQAHNMSLERVLGEAIEDDDMPAVVGADVVAQRIMEYLESVGARHNDDFKLYPKGAYKGRYADNADFVMATSGVIADAFEEYWDMREKVAQIAKEGGYHMEMATASIAAFYKEDPYWDLQHAADEPPVPPPDDAPPVNLRDIQF